MRWVRTPQLSKLLPAALSARLFLVGSPSRNLRFWRNPHIKGAKILEIPRRGGAEIPKSEAGARAETLEIRLKELWNSGNRGTKGANPGNPVAWVLGAEETAVVQ